MKISTALFLLSVLFVSFFSACAGGPSYAEGPRQLPPQEYARAFIDFSGYTGPSTFPGHQPPEGTQGEFALDNGIIGDGLRVVHIGDQNLPVTIEQYGDGMAVKGPNYLSFIIDHEVLRQAHTVIMYVTYFDGASGHFRIQYISDASPYTGATMPINGNSEFVTVGVQLNNCNFNGSPQNLGAQFRLDFGAIIQRVEIVTGFISDTIGDPPPFAPPTELNNMIGKVVTGYQAWFGRSGGWGHWRSNQPWNLPSPGNISVEMWPAGWEDYTANGAQLRSSGFAMSDGSAAQLFSSHDPGVILTHQQWLRDAGIDGSAIQRFFSETTTADTGDAPSYLTRIKDAAEATGRIFYVMYDMSGAGSTDQSLFVRQVQLDWMYNVENKGLVSSPNYAQAEGKPVVCIWGIYSPQNTRFASVEATIELIQWFRNRGYYVKGGIPDDNFWETDGGRHRRSRELYSSVDMISPWYVGRPVSAEILGGNQWMRRAMEFCRTNRRSWADNKPINFMPTIWPGFAWTNLGPPGLPNSRPRNAGQHIWSQVRGYLNFDTNHEIKGLYLAMFDEYDEATAWMKTAVDSYDIPVEQYFLTLAADGIWLSSDYYMRVARAAADVFRNRSPGSEIGPLNEYTNPHSVIVEHSLGPVFWRNGFERRRGRSIQNNALVPAGHLPLDVGIPNRGVLGTPLNISVTGAITVNRPAVNSGTDTYTPFSETLGMIYSDAARSGESVFRLAGQRTAGQNALYRYRIAHTRIRVESGMRLRYWIRAEDTLGSNVMVDLLLDNGDYVSDSVAAVNTGSPQDGWQQRTLTIPAAMNDRIISAVIIGYRDSGSDTGNFAALIDDISISN